MPSVKDFLEILKLPPSILGAISLASGLILFLPEEALNALYMVNFRNDFGFILGPVFILSISILSIMLGAFIVKRIADKISWKRINRKTEAYLLSADSVKTTLIREFLADETHTLSLPMNDGLVIELNSLGIISMAGKTQVTGPRFDGQLKVRYFLQPRIISIIDNNPELKKKYKRK